MSIPQIWSRQKWGFCLMAVSEERLRILRKNNTESKLETRNCIKEAFLTLLKEKDYGNIRMTDIIRKSGVSRSGVYKNYKNKDEILIEIYREPIDDIISALTDSLDANLELAFRMGKKYENSIKIIIDAGLEHNFLKVLNKRYEDASAQSFYVPLWNGMIFNIFIEWARAGMNGTVEETVEKVNTGLKLVARSIETRIINTSTDPDNALVQTKSSSDT